MKFKKIKQLSICICIAILALNLVSCGKDKEKEKPKEKPKKAEINIGAINKAYKDVLVENQTGISTYSWQMDKNNNPVSRPVAIKDINGDKIPELFFVTANSQWEASLHIYTYINGQAKEVEYQHTDQNADALKIINVAAGTDYMVYQGKTDGRLYIISSMGDESITYSVSKYTFKDGRLTRDDYFSDRIGPNDNYSGMVDIYKHQGKEISASEGKNLFVDAGADVKGVIIYSGYEKDISAWNKFQIGEELSLSYQDAIRQLS